MDTDSEELRFQIESEKNDPVLQIAAMRDVVDAIESRLRYDLPRLRFVIWILVILLLLILWRLAELNI